MVQLVNEGIRPPTLMTVSKGAQYDDFTIHRLYGTGNFSNVSHQPIDLFHFSRIIFFK